jgi:alpha-galactosidase
MKKILAVCMLFNSFFLFGQESMNLALTPPMGWNSWNAFQDKIDEKLIREMADAMVSSGMKDVGYEYINLDDCWQVSRDANGTIVADSVKFPSGIKALADYVHSKGLKFGLYSCAGSKTCAGRPGSRGHEFQDARTYASWGVDYLKYDFCNTDDQNAEGAYKIIHDALMAAKRPVVLEICEWGGTKPWTWGKGVGSLWRTTGDIMDCYDCTYNWGGFGWTRILDKNADLNQYAGPGGWNHPDMLEVGNGGLTDIEARSHFTLWCMMAAPLIAGNDIRSMLPAIRQILTNKELIAIDQDSLGKQGFRWLVFNGIELWVKPLKNKEMALCFFNRGDVVKALNFNWKKEHHIFNAAGDGTSFNLENLNIKDVWLNKIIGTTKNNLKAEILPHDVLIVKLYK